MISAAEAEAGLMGEAASVGAGAAGPCRVRGGGVERGGRVGQPMSVAVRPAGRNLVAFHRMDGAWVASTDIAIDKAFTSAGRGLTTRKIGEMAQPGPPPPALHR